MRQQEAFDQRYARAPTVKPLLALRGKSVEVPIDLKTVFRLIWIGHLHQFLLLLRLPCPVPTVKKGVDHVWTFVIRHFVSLLLPHLREPVPYTRTPPTLKPLPQ